MPSDVVSMVTTGFGVSVLAGILSGVCYVIAHRGISIRKNRIRKPSNEWCCKICGTYLNQVAELVEGKLVSCKKCQLLVCKEKCSTFIKTAGWMCENCLNPSWFEGIIHNGLLSSISSMSSQKSVDEEKESLRKIEREQVRDFIEKLVNVMLEENVDSASVTRIYSDPQYHQIFTKYHQELSRTLTELGSALHISISNLPTTGQSTSSAHAALKQLISNLLEESVALPQLKKRGSTESLQNDHTANRSYEDLLSTAIINKVVSCCQNNLPTSSAHSDSGRVSSSSRHGHRDDSKEYFFGEETLENKWKNTDPDTTSVSSLEEWMTKSESSLNSKKYVDRFTLTIKQNIEEVDACETDDEDEDDPDHFRTNSSLLSYHEADANWFLQRRHFRGTPSPVPVPMLVPNPTTEAKVLIGDKPVDDTSDLSDIGSEDYDYKPEPPLSAHTLLVESKTLIGGKSNISLLDDSHELNNDGVEEYEQSESSTDSGVKEVNGKEDRKYDRMKREERLLDHDRLKRNERMEHENESAKTDATVDDDNIEDSSYLSIYSNTEQEAEYTEKYASLPRTVMKTSTSPSRPSRQKDKDKEINVLLDEPMHFVGNYSKKEIEKWNHGVEMKNNPYSKENIEKRIRRSSSSVSSLFGPDYYARQAKSPSGAKSKSSEINGVSWPPQRNLSDDLIENESYTLHKAIQAITTTDSENEVFHENHSELNEDQSTLTRYQVNTREEKLVTEEKTVHHDVQNITNLAQYTSDITTSDSDLSYVNFYDVEHSQIVMKTKNEDIKIPIKSSSLIGTFKPLPDVNGNNHKEENKNNDIEEAVQPILKGTPVVKPRMIEQHQKVELFTKKQPNSVQKSFGTVSTTNPHVIRRHMSESDVLDSFDAPPRALHPKKDNTLISRIYKHNRVRQYASSSREDLVNEDYRNGKDEYSVEEAEIVPLTTTIVLNKQPGKEYFDNGLSKIPLYHSVDDLSSEQEFSSGKTGKMSFFSSEEDLLSIHSDASFAIVEKRPPSRESYRSYSSGQYTPTPLPMSTKRFIYSSSEDLLSNNEEVGSLPRRKDNTLISRIYKDPNVRKVALSLREFVPDDADGTLTPTATRSRSVSHYSSDDDQLTQALPAVAKATHPLYGRNDNLAESFLKVSETQTKILNEIEQLKQNEKKDVTTEDSESEAEKMRRKHRKTQELQDVEEVAKKKLVNNILDKFIEYPQNPRLSRTTSIDDLDEIKISVKDLRKKFENSNGKSKHVASSLTARSLSKQMKESLKQ